MRCELSYNINIESLFEKRIKLKLLNYFLLVMYSLQYFHFALAENRIFLLKRKRNYLITFHLNKLYVIGFQTFFSRPT
jgi:hypothetical protein